MPILLNDNLNVQAPRAVDNRYGPHANVSNVHADVTPAIRYQGLTVGVNTANGIVEYWFASNTTNAGLVLKTVESVAAAEASLTSNGIVRLNDTLTSPNTFQALTANMGRYLDAKSVPNTRQILTAGGAITGGGDLTADRTLVIANASLSVNGVVRLEDSLTSTNTGTAATANIVRYLDTYKVSNTDIFAGSTTRPGLVPANNAGNGMYVLTSSGTWVPPSSGGGGGGGTVTSVTVAGGNGLQSTGSPVTISGTITVSANDASTSVNGVVRLNDTYTSANTGQALTANMGKYITDTLTLSNVVPIGGIRYFGGYNVTSRQYTASATDQPTLLDWSGANTGNLVGDRTYVWRIQTLGTGVLFDSAIYYASVSATNIPSPPYPHLKLNTVNTNQPEIVLTANTYRITSNHASPYVFQVITEEWPNDTVFPASLSAVAYSHTGGLRLFSTDGTNQPIIGQGARVWNEMNQGPDSNLHADLLDTFHANAFANSVIANSRTIFTGNGLLGGGPLSGNLTITANDASTSVNGVVRLNDSLTSQNTGQALTANMGFYLAQLDLGRVPNTRTISTTSPLTGGGDLTTDRTLSIQAASTTQNGEVRLNDTLTSANVGQALTANMGRYLDAKSVPNTRQILTAGGAITGGGDLTADRTLVIANASLSVNGVVRLEDSLTSTNIGTAATANIVRYLDVYKVSNTRQVLTSGGAITGGGTLQNDLTITVANASTTVNGVVRLNDSLTSQNTGQALTANMGFYLAQLDLGRVPNTFTLTTGSGLNGGGDFTTNRTIVANDASISVNGVVRLNDTLTSTNVGQAATANIVRYLETKSVQNNRTISTTSPLTGGGDLTADRTLSIQAASTTQNGEVRLNDTLTSANVGQALTANMGRYLEAKSVPNTRQILTAGGAITGGGDLTADRTLVIANASLSVNGVVRLEDSLTSTNIGTAATANIVRYLDTYKVSNTDIFAGSTTRPGLVPANNAGNGMYILTSSGTWVPPGTGGGGGGGTVTSVTVAAGPGLVSTGSPITITGTITVSANDASTSVNGVVRLEDSLTSTNVGTAPTSNIVRYLDVYKVSNTRTISTTSPLTGGGSMAADRTLSIQAASTTQNGEVRLNDTLTSQNTFQALTANMGFYLTQLDLGRVPNTRTISTTSPLTGGGDLTTDRTFAIQAATLTQNGEVRLNDTLTSANLGQALTANMGRYLEAKSVPNTRQILTAGGAITGGGDLTADRTLIVANASLTVNGVVRLEDSLTSTNTGTAPTSNIVRYLDVYKVSNTRQILTSGGALTGGGTLQNDLTLTVANASLSVNGVVRLNDTLTSQNTGQALTANMGFYLSQLDGGRVPNTRIISTTSPLTGGGDLTTDRTFAITAASLTTNGEVRLNDTLTSANLGQALTANMGRYLEAKSVPNTRQVLTSGGALTGGGTLVSDLTLTVANASLSVNGVVRLNDTLTGQNTGQALTANMGFYLAQLDGGRVPNTRTISTTSPLTGGGDLTADRTLTIQAASTTQNGEVRLNDTLTSSNLGQAATANIVRYLDVYKVSNTRQVLTAGGGVTGGGALTADITIIAANASLTTNGVVRLEDSLTSTNVGTAATANIVRYLDVYKVSNTRTISTTSPLLGGGTLAADRTLSIQAASTTQNGEVRLNDTVTSSNNFQAVTANVANILARPFIGTYDGLVSNNATNNPTGNGVYLLSAAGTWVPPGSGGGSGSVTSVTVAGGNGLQSTGSPITLSGTITVSANDASTSVNGVVRLNDTLTSTNTGQAATANIVRYLETKSVQNNRTISTTSPLTGGGDLTADRTLSIQAASTTQNGEVRLNDTLTSANVGQALTANMGRYLEAKSVPNTRQVLTAGGGVTGGGALTADITIIAANASLTVNGVVRLEDSLLSTNVGTAATANIVRYLDVYKVSNTRTISTTSPLSGGGSLTSDRTISIQAASTTQNGEVRLNDTLTSQNTFQALTANMGFYLTQLDGGKVQNTFTISTTSPLAGGGDLTTNRTLTIQAATLTQNGEVRLNDTLTSANLGQALTANMGRYLEAKSVPNTRQVLTAGGGVTGGGALTADITIIAANASLTVNGVVRLEDSLTSTNIGTAATANIVRYLDVYKVSNTRTISTTSPLLGGGSLAADRTLSIQAASTTQNGEVRLNDTFLSQNTFQAVTANVANALARIFSTANAGLVPVSPGGTTDFLRADGTWSAPSGGPGGGISNTQDNLWTGNNIFYINDANSSTITRSITIGHGNTGTAGSQTAPGFGTGITFSLESNTGINLDAAYIDVVWANPNNTTYGANMSIKLASGGAAPTEVVSLSNSGQFIVTGSQSEVRGTTLVATGWTYVGASANIAFGVIASTMNVNGLRVRDQNGSEPVSGQILIGNSISGFLEKGNLTQGTGLLVTRGATSLAIAANDASTSVNGVVRLEDSLTSTNTGTAPTSNIVRYLDVYKVSNTRTISTTSPLSGGGSLAADRTLSIQAASTTQNGETRLNDTLAGQNNFQALTANMGFWIASQLVGKVQNTFTISTTSPLAGGGDLTTNRTLTIQAASTTQNGEVRLNDTLTSANVGQAATANMIRYLEAKSVQNTRQVLTAGGGVTGGGALTADITIIAANASLTVNGVVRLEDSLTSLNIGTAATANIVRYLDVYKVSNTRTISTTSPLTGGGSLAADRTLAIQAASTTQNGEVRLNDTLTSTNVGQAATANIVRYLETKSVQNNRLISTTSPLTGGGDLTADRTLAIQAASTTQNGEVRLNDTLSSVNTFQALTANQGRALGRVFTTTYDGLVPTPGPSTGRLLRDDSTWVTVSGTGTVTSIDIRPGEGLSNSGGPITGAGSIWVNTVIFSASTNGAVPKSVTADGTKYLRDDATWQTVSAGPGGSSAFDYGTTIAMQRGLFL